MRHNKPYTWIGITTIISGVIALASLVATMAAVNNHADALSNPMLILTLPGANAGLTRWAMLFDMLGYYLLLLPLIFFLRQWLRADALQASIIRFCGTAYVLVGAIGAAILAAVWPYIIDAYKTASPALQPVLAENFRFFNMMVYDGLWNVLELIFAAAWWLFTGVQFYRNRFRVLGILTLILGSSCLGDALSGMFQLNSLHEISLNIYLLLAIVWAIVMGIFILRNGSVLSAPPVAHGIKRAQRSISEIV